MDPSSSKEAKSSLDAAKKKLDGKYFPFGRLVEGQDVLRRLEEEVQADGAEKPVPKVWVDAAGVVPDE
jgi:cyclophilin family peptidyl-prolyl cis-trans isomerase